MKRCSTCWTADRHGCQHHDKIPRARQRQERPRAPDGIRGTASTRISIPRAKIIRGMCYRVLEKLLGEDRQSRCSNSSLKLEEIALKDEYFVSRKLYPNVDFYSGIIYSALGIPRSMFTVMFGRLPVFTAGWVAQWAGNGVRSAHENRPAAPASYTGPTQRDYQPLRQISAERGDAAGFHAPIARMPRRYTLDVLSSAMALLLQIAVRRECRPWGWCRRKISAPTRRVRLPSAAAQWNGWGRGLGQYAISAGARDPRPADVAGNSR